jgi:hypothetical protein
VKDYRQGQHICVLYDTAEEQRTVAAAYIADGLAFGDRCYYVADSAPALRQFQVALGRVGVDVEQVLRSRAFLEATCDDAHLVDGHFDCERMLAMLNHAVETALNDGFAGLRTCGDMSWLLGDPPGAQQVVEYEALLNQFFRGVRACGMCQYDRRRLPDTLLDHALATHSSAVIGGLHKTNPFFEPTASARRAAQPLELETKLWELRQR